MSNRRDGIEGQVEPDSFLNSLLAKLAEANRSNCAPLEVRERLLAEVESARLYSHRGRPSGRMPQALLQVTLWVAAVVTLVIAAGALLAPVRLSNDLSSIGASPTNERSNLRPAAALDDSQTMLANAGYVSLPYSDPSIANGTEATVRISVPASELMAWGVPSVARGPDEDVAADLLLGDDGLPQAIRILPVTSSTSTNEENYP